MHAALEIILGSPDVLDTLCGFLNWIDLCVLRLVSQEFRRQTLRYFIRKTPRNLQADTYAMLNLRDELEPADVSRYGLQDRPSVVEAGLVKDDSLESLRLSIMTRDLGHLRSCSITENVAFELMEILLEISDYPNNSREIEIFRLLFASMGTQRAWIHILGSLLRVQHINLMMDMGLSVGMFAGTIVTSREPEAADTLRRYCEIYPDEMTSALMHVTPESRRDVAMLIAETFPITGCMRYHDPGVAQRCLERCPSRLQDYYRIIAGLEPMSRRVSIQSLEAALLSGNVDIVSRASTRGKYGATNSICIRYAVEWDSIPLDLLARVDGLRSRVLEACVLYGLDPPVLVRSIPLSIAATVSDDCPQRLERFLPRPGRYPMKVLEAAILNDRVEIVRHICRKAQSININMYLLMLPMIREPARSLTGQLDESRVYPVKWKPHMKDPLSLIPKKCSFRHRDAILVTIIITDPKVVTMRKYGSRVISHELLRNSAMAADREDIRLI
jgi:hypothetical protein